MQLVRVLGAIRVLTQRGVVQPAAGWRRTSLKLRLHLNAWLQRSTVEVDIAPDVKVGKRIYVEVARKTHTTVRIGARTKLGDGVRLRLHGGSISLGAGIDVRGHAVLSVSGGDLVLEGPNNLSWGVTVHCAESIYLEKFSHVAEYTTIVDNSHYYSDPDGWSYHNLRTAPIRLGQDVWVCPKATITSGVTIGHHTIIASNTVVVKNVPSGVLFSGVPGRVIRELDLPWEES